MLCGVGVVSGAWGDVVSKGSEFQVPWGAFGPGLLFNHADVGLHPSICGVVYLETWFKSACLKRSIEAGALRVLSRCL